ncbi:MAG: hypothetical protein JSU86_18355 [Phycisphaerales bacterium]|nr:MAG: hypothetical protein JSU86_18355 [Phycisphaerales bacterium]
MYLLVALLAAASVLDLACAETTRYRVLTFFFEGVPKPGEAPVTDVGPEVATKQEGALSARERRRARRPTFHSHSPYLQKRCSDCHRRDSGALIRPADQGLCQICHTDIPGDMQYVHGPVVVNACMFCHHQHQSLHPGLLRAESRSLCLRCHEPDAPPTGQHIETVGERACIDCHDAHGGNDRFFLKRAEP